MIEFKKANSLQLSHWERLEVPLRVVDPLFAAVWRASLRHGTGIAFLELESQRAIGALIERDGIVRWRLDCEDREDRNEFAIEYMLRNAETNPAKLLIFGSAADSWLKFAAARADSKIYCVDFQDLGRAVAACADLVCDERVSAGGWNNEKPRVAFKEMMDRAFEAAIRVGCDADDVECERLVRTNPGGCWWTLEEWARDPKAPPVELRLRSVIARPAPMLPALVQVL